MPLPWGTHKNSIDVCSGKQIKIIIRAILVNCRYRTAGFFNQSQRIFDHARVWIGQSNNIDIGTLEHFLNVGLASKTGGDKAQANAIFSTRIK